MNIGLEGKMLVMPYILHGSSYHGRAAHRYPGRRLAGLAGALLIAFWEVISRKQGPVLWWESCSIYFALGFTTSTARFVGVSTDKIKVDILKNIEILLSKNPLHRRHFLANNSFVYHSFGSCCRGMVPSVTEQVNLGLKVNGAGKSQKQLPVRVLML